MALVREMTARAGRVPARFPKLGREASGYSPASIPLRGRLNGLPCTTLRAEGCVAEMGGQIIA